MKGIAAVFIVTIAAVAAMPPPEVLNMIGDCKTKTGATDADVGNMMAHKPPSSTEAKCMISCIMEGFGIVSREFYGQLRFFGAFSFWK